MSPPGRVRPKCCLKDNVTSLLVVIMFSSMLNNKIEVFTRNQLTESVQLRTYFHPALIYFTQLANSRAATLADC